MYPKIGSAPVMDVLAYGQPVRTQGLNLLSAPGNDLVASTALAASGAQIVLFTTGRGTPFASPVPTVKISSNSNLYQKKNNWIDFNCGALVDGAPSDKWEKHFLNMSWKLPPDVLLKPKKPVFTIWPIFKQGVTL
mgnify:FL=1